MQALIILPLIVLFFLPIGIALQKNHPRKLLITFILAGSILILPALFAVIAPEQLNLLSWLSFGSAWLFTMYLCFKKPKSQNAKK